MPMLTKSSLLPLVVMEPGEAGVASTRFSAPGSRWRVSPCQSLDDFPRPGHSLDRFRGDAGTIAPGRDSQNLFQRKAFPVSQNRTPAIDRTRWENVTDRPESASPCGCVSPSATLKA